MEIRIPSKNKRTPLQSLPNHFPPVIDYYNSLFKNEGGDIHKMRKCALACRILDAFFLKGRQNDLHILNDIADDLKYFDYSHFFLVLLKREIPVAISHANQPFN